MSIQITFPFDSSSNYTYDTDLVEITGGEAKLKLIDDPGQNFDIDFSNDTGFTYDSSKSEFVGGVVRQVDQRPANSIVGATFATSLNASWASDGFGSLSANLNGVPTLSGEKASCIGSQGLYYQDTAIGTLSGDMVIKFKYTPQYTGSPSANYNIVSIATPSSSTDRIVIFDNPVGLRITANGLAAVVFGSWSPVSGNEYVFEVHIISNVVSLYVDNVQIGTGKTITPGQGTGATQLWIGAYTGIYDDSNALFDDLILYSTASQTPTYTVPDYAYFDNVVTTPELEYTGVGTLVSFDSFTTTETDTPRYSLQIGRSGIYIYYNGVAWVSSDGTYSQANDATTFNANVGTLNVNGEIYGQFKIHFQNSNTQSNVDFLRASLTAQIYPTTNPIVQINTTFRGDSWSEIIETSVKTGSDEIKYNLIENSDVLFWDGAAWTSSNETYAQSNTATEINAQFPKIATMATTYAIQFYLHSEDGSTTPSIQELTVSYDVAGEERVDVNTCEMYFDSALISGGLNGNVLTVSLDNDNVYYKDTVLILNETITLTDDVSGRYIFDLIETENMNTLANGSQQTYSLYIDRVRTFKFSVPNLPTANMFNYLR